MPGLFVSLDGVDGAGKSTQVDLLREWLRAQGQAVVSIRDPGGTKLGEALRDILLHRREIEMSMTAEMLLYMASRAQLVAEVIQPALAANSVVIADRFLLANVVYQGSAGGEDVEQIWQVGEVATGGLQPDLTFVLDLPVDVAMQRIDRGLDRLESRGAEYMSKVRDGFLSQSQRLGNQVCMIDATASPQAIHEQILAALQRARPEIKK